MASEKPKQGDKSPKPNPSRQSNEEFASFSPLDVVVDSHGTGDHIANRVPYYATRAMYGVPQPYGQGMPYFSVPEDDIYKTGYGYSYEPVSYFQPLVRDVNEFGHNDALGAMGALAAAVDNYVVNDLDNSEIERNIAATGAVAGGLQMSRPGEEGNVNDIHRTWLRGNPMPYAGSATVLGHQQTSRDFGMTSLQLQKAGGEARHNNICGPLVNTSSGQNIAKSSLTSSSNMVSGFSDFQNYVGGFSRVAGLHQTQNIDGFSTLGQNAVGVSDQARNTVGMQNAGFPQNVAWFTRPPGNESGQILSPLVDKQYFHIPSLGDSGLGESSNVNPSTSFQGFRTHLPMPNFSNQVSTPDAAFLRTAGLPSSSSSVMIASNQLQNPQVGAVRNLSPEPSAVSHSILYKRNRTWGQNSRLGQCVQASRVFAAQAAKGGQLCNNTGVWPPGNQGQEIQAVNSSTSSTGPSRKRAAATFPSDAPEARQTKTRSPEPSRHLSNPALLQSGLPDVPLAPNNRLSQRMHRPLPNTSYRQFPSRSKASPLLHIKTQAKKKESPKPSGYKCGLCKRDLSFEPEGPIEQTDKLIPAAVLPCGHLFHESCLLLITPENQAQDPPCIPCAMGDNNN